MIVFVEDAAASGGYFIATAGDEIIADPSSIVGSIGVIFAGFGFVDAIDKLGIERRVHTAGKNKSTLDPFLPEKKEDVERIKTLELDIHQVFIDWVKSRRAGKLKATDDELFTGEFWSGRRGLELGLIDGIGDLRETLRARYGEKVRLKVIEPKRPLFRLPTPRPRRSRVSRRHGHRSHRRDRGPRLLVEARALDDLRSFSASCSSPSSAASSTSASAASGATGRTSSAPRTRPSTSATSRNAPAPTSSPSSATRTAPSVPRMATAGVDLTR